MQPSTSCLKTLESEETSLKSWTVGMFFFGTGNLVNLQSKSDRRLCTKHNKDTPLYAGVLTLLLSGPNEFQWFELACLHKTSASTNVYLSWFSSYDSLRIIICARSCVSHILINVWSVGINSFYDGSLWLLRSTYRLKLILLNACSWCVIEVTSDNDNIPIKISNGFIHSHDRRLFWS